MQHLQPGMKSFQDITRAICMPVCWSTGLQQSLVDNVCLCFTASAAWEAVKLCSTSQTGSLCSED